MLGIALVLVGIVLVHNGIMFLSKSRVVTKGEDGQEITTVVPMVVASPKSIAFFNLIVGLALVVGNLIVFAFHTTYGVYASFQNIAAGLLFGITYLFIAGNLLFKLDPRPFGIYCLGVAIFSAVAAVYSLVQLADIGMTYGYSFLILALLWISWLIVWLAGFLQFNLKIKFVDKAFPYLSIIVGVVGAFVPALLLLTGVWSLWG